MVTIVSMFKGLESRYYRLLVPLLLMPTGFAIDYLVKTDYEKIDNAVKIFTDSAVKQTPEKIPPIIADVYRDDSNKSKQQFMNLCKRIFSEPNIKKINRKFFNITIDGDSATCQTSVVVILNPESPYAAFSSIMTVEARAYFQKNDKKQWHMTSSEIITVNNRPASWKDAP